MIALEQGMELIGFPYPDNPKEIIELGDTARIYSGEHSQGYWEFDFDLVLDLSNIYYLYFADHITLIKKKESL